MVGTSIDQVRSFFELVAEWQGNSRLVDRLVTYFLEAGPFDDEQRLSRVEVLQGLTLAFHVSKLGLWLDHSEAYALNERCMDVIEFSVGRPEVFWNEPEKYTEFRWAGSSVVDGLRAFDDWLKDENVELRGEDPLRLLNIDTGADFYLSILCPQNVVPEAVRQLEDLGFSAHLPGVPDELDSLH